MTVKQTPDRGSCVLCGEPNECALARGGGTSEDPCWCFEASFPVELLAAATTKDGGQSCVCRRCLERGPSELGSQGP